MNTPAHDTALFLSALDGFGDFGDTSEWSTYVGREPVASGSVVNVVTCYDTGGGPGPLIDFRKPTVQVRVRSASYNAGWQKINEAYEALVQPYYSSAPDVAILGWVPTSDCAFIGRDDQDHSLFTVNFEVMRSGASNQEA